MLTPRAVIAMIVVVVQGREKVVTAVVGSHMSVENGVCVEAGIVVYVHAAEAGSSQVAHMTDVSVLLARGS